ncbi:MAG: InlB B-repeat-containing protein [Clostridia bacterium]|nr:InlB B-repeat-containing protein [Clostridia bacterium]
MKLKNALLAVVLVLVLMTASACNMYNEPANSVKLNLNGGSVESTLTTYTPGQETTLPEPTREHYTFEGWYASANFEGEAVEKIPATAEGKITYWAKWTPEVYTVTLNANGGTVANSITEYTYGVGATLPSATRPGYDFDGWRDSGNATVTAISETDFGNKAYTAFWSGKSYNVKLNLKGGELANNLTKYTYGVETPLPEPTRTGYNFLGWFESENFDGNAITKINANDEAADREFWAKWEAKAAISATFGGYDEGAYVLIDPQSKYNVSDVTVSYKLLDDMASYKAIDSQLIRTTTKSNKTYIRADLVGLKAGAYSVKVTAKGNEVVKDVTVTAQDRSGYAHFDSSTSDKVYAAGVGGYKNDGTPKSNAYIIYVSEATKNSVVAPWDSNKVGIVSILTSLSSANKPVIIRVLDTIKAATWNEINYTKNSDGSLLTSQYIINQTKAKTGKELSTQTYTQEQLESMNVNTYNTSVATKLDNLTGSMKYDGSKDEFDSCWNDCVITSASNVTVEGIGINAGLFQWGMTWKKSTSIEIKNLKFDAYTEDACSFEGSKNESATSADDFDTKRIWLHNNTFNVGVNYWDVCKEQDKHDGDGSTDFKFCSYITLSYNHYVETHKTGLIGGDNKHLTANVTFHHNYYESCKSRLPLARQANMHMYNNYYHNAGTSISLRANAYAFIEYCYFDGSNNTMIDIQGNKGATGQYGVAKLFNCVMNGNGYTYNDLVNSEKTNDVKKLMIVTVTDRSKQVASSNRFCPNFDTKSDKFYYDSANKKSNVTNLITKTSDIPTLIPQLAGVLTAGK